MDSVDHGSEKEMNQLNAQSIVTSDMEINRATVLSIMPHNVRAEFDKDPTSPFKHDIEYYCTLETIFYLRLLACLPSSYPKSNPAPQPILNFNPNSNHLVIYLGCMASSS